MLDAVLATAKNPGTFDPTGAQYGWLLLFPVIAVAVEVVFMLRRRRSDEFITAEIVVVFGILACVGGGLVSTVVWSAASTVHEDQQQAAYSRSVQAWLADDYGVTTSSENAFQLTHGHAFAAAYRGHEVVLSVVPDVNGNLELVDRHNTVLTPTN